MKKTFELFVRRLERIRNGLFKMVEIIGLSFVDLRMSCLFAGGSHRILASGYLSPGPCPKYR